MKRYAISYGIKEFQIETTMSYQSTPIRKAKIQSTDKTKCGQGYRFQGTRIHCWLECEMSLSKSWARFYNTKYILIIGFSNYCPWYLLIWVENLCP